MCRNWCEYRYDAIELSKAYVCIWIPLSHRDKEMWVVPRLARKRGMGKCQGDCGIPQPGLQSEDMPQKPLDISTLLFYPRAEEQQESLPGEQPRDADAARIHKSVRVCSRMVHQEKPQQMLRLFCCTIPFGTDSHFAQALVFVSRGLVAKNAPQEHFLNAPTDGAPKYALQEIAARFLLQSFKEGSIWCTIG